MNTASMTHTIWNAGSTPFVVGLLLVYGHHAIESVVPHAAVAVAPWSGIVPAGATMSMYDTHSETARAWPATSQSIICTLTR